jgi:predicted transcriptional regulator
MSTDRGGRNKKMSDNEILRAVRNHDDPCVTSSEIAEELDVTNDAVNYRLRKLAEAGAVRGKTVGASAKVWYVVG